MSQTSIAGSYAMLRGTEIYRDSIGYIQSVMDSLYAQKDKLFGGKEDEGKADKEEQKEEK